jgi:hypothetical protein
MSSANSRSLNGGFLIQNGNPPAAAFNPGGAFYHCAFGKGVPRLFAEAQSFIVEDYGSCIGHKPRKFRSS